MENFFTQIPAYQNSWNTIWRSKGFISCIGAFENDSLVGFLVFTPANSKVKLFGVHKMYRRKYIATAMFMFLKDNIGDNEITILNIEETDTPTVQFIEKMGLVQYIQQYEMMYKYEN
jgi:hypothetical protein